MSEALSAFELQEQLEELEASGRALRQRSVESILVSVRAAWDAIANPELALGREARESLPASTGLTLEMVAWALSTALHPSRLNELEEIAKRMEAPAGMRRAPPSMSAVILAGNVFTACVSPLSVSMLGRAPVVLKASSRDDVLPRLFWRALDDVDSELASSCLVVTFEGGTSALESTLLSRADFVSAYGSDRTISSIRQRINAGATFVPHGHGLGVGFATKEALSSDAAAAAAADSFALDVAAYDQRGCLSPHAIFVEEGASTDGASFTARLARSLANRAESLPRGPLSVAVGATQVQWRGVAASRGELVEGDGWAVSFEGGASVRLSPGYRNVAVLSTPSASAFASYLPRFGPHLKAIGVAGSAEARADVAARLEPPLAPRICPAGAMQTPSLSAPSDGYLPEAGFVRWIQVD